MTSMEVIFGFIGKNGKHRSKNVVQWKKGFAG